MLYLKLSNIFVLIKFTVLPTNDWLTKSDATDVMVSIKEKIYADSNNSSIYYFYKLLRSRFLDSSNKYPKLDLL